MTDVHKTEIYSSVAEFAIGVAKRTKEGWEVDFQNEYKWPRNLGLASFEVSYVKVENSPPAPPPPPPTRYVQENRKPAGRPKKG